jgi:hypothetical protein
MLDLFGFEQPKLLGEAIERGALAAEFQFLHVARKHARLDFTVLVATHSEGLLDLQARDRSGDVGRDILDWQQAALGVEGLPDVDERQFLVFRYDAPRQAGRIVAE